MSVELQSGYAVFKPRARLLKLIGAELISDDVVAVTELVKNAFDADATLVSVVFRGASSAAGDIVITDDGFGMDRGILLSGWMEPAGSTKVKGQRFSPKGRRVLGEKGLGRFAADKLASQLDLVSRKADAATEVHAVFDWDQFDNDTHLLGDIRSQWDIRRATQIQSHGTELRLTGLRASWTERMFRRLATRLSRLLSPFRGRDDFRIRLESDEFPEYSGDISSGFLDAAPYKIEASFDGVDSIETKLGQGNKTKHVWTGPGSLDCGAVRIRLYAFDLETESLSKLGPRSEVRAWLREWTGVSVYRDGFRVWPYGEPHDDWLRLDQRRVNNPVVRLSNNQVVGFVEISRDGNAALVDQTNREGMVNTQALEDLRKLLYHVLQLVEAERQRIRHGGSKNRQIKARSESDAASVETIEEIAQTLGPNPRTRLRQAANDLSRRIDSKEKTAQSYASLAAAGRHAQGIAPELGRSLEAIESALAAVAEHLPRGASNALNKEVAIARSKLLLMSTLAESEGRRRTLDVPAEIESYFRTIKSMIEDAGAQVTLDLPANGVLRIDMPKTSFQHLLHIFTENALDWTRDGERPELKISAVADGDDCRILISDNGPGVPEEMSERLFEPHFSLKAGGSGLGLALAADIARAHGARVSLVSDKRRRGATFEIWASRKKSRSTR